MPNYIIEYYQAIKDGSAVVGRWIVLFYEYIIKGLENKSFYFDQKKANKAIKFMESYVHHHEGKLAPELVKLELWQKATLSVMFGIVDGAGFRQFREVVLIVARKNGKTLFASGVAEYMTFCDDYGARIYFLAPKLEQANLCFEAFNQSINQEPTLKSLAKKRRTDVYIAENNATAKPLAFSAKKSDGLNVSLGVADEIASWQGQNGLRFYEVIKSSFGARLEPILFSISTAGYENEGIYDELFKRGSRVLLGDSKETRLAPIFYTIDDPTKWNDINELRKSNPNLGVSVSVDFLLEEIAIAEGSLSKRAEFLTKYCNIKQNLSLAWLSTQDVKKACGKPLVFDDFKETYCVGGIDLSQTTDLTACTCVIEKDGRLHCFAKFFLPREKIDEAIERDGLPYYQYIEKGWLQLSGDNFVDYHDAFQWFADLVETYHIYPLVIGYDRYSAQYLVQDMRAYGFNMDDVYQGDNLYPVLLEFEGLLKDGIVDIGDNDLLKIHLLNSALKMSQERGRGRLVKLSPKDHIDGMASLSDAFTVRQKWFGQYGEQLRND